jgi:hypothetical protein
MHLKIGIKTTLCTVDGCGNSLKSRGYCGKHYQRWYKYGDPTLLSSHSTIACTFPGCSTPMSKKKLCGMHYMQWKYKQKVKS